jgi:threonine dehydratase
MSSIPSSYKGIITIEEIQKAQVRISPFVNRTPLVAKGSLCRDSGFSNLFFKCEALQRTGTFKLRGAVNAVMAIDEQKQARPYHFVSHSSGNFGGALAKAARFADSTATIVVPSAASSQKVEAMKSFGANVVVVRENSVEAREAAAKKIAVERPGSFFIHPHDDPMVIAAQGTVALEFIEQVSNVLVGQERKRRQHEFLKQQQKQQQQNKIISSLQNNNNAVPEFIAPDIVILPLGGGGLLAGAAVAVRELCGPGTLIIGAEPAFAPDASTAFKSGVVAVDNNKTTTTTTRTTHTLQRPERTVADGLSTHMSQPLLDLIKANVDDIVAVSEQEIGRATVLIFQRLKIVVEPAAALAAAVALFHRDSIAKKFPKNQLRTCVVLLSEGNIDVERINELSKL